MNIVSYCNTFLLLLQFLVAHQAVLGQQRLLYVRINNESPCPANSTQCQTLRWYTNRSTSSFASNTMMLFQEGIHILDIFVQINGCHNFTISGNGSAVYYPSDSHPHPTSRVKCNGASNSGFVFSNSSNIHIYNLKLESCSGQYTLKEKYKNAGALVFMFVENVTLDQIVISNAMGYGLQTFNIFGANEILNSAFLHTIKHPDITDSGNANIYFDENLSNMNITMNVNSTWFLYGQTVGEFNAAGGLNVFIYCPNVHITIENVTTKGNIGANGGNLALFLKLFSTNSGSMAINGSHIVDGRANKGGGLRFWLKQNRITKRSSSHRVHTIFSIQNTLFHNNSVRQTGGAMYMAYYNNSTMNSFDGNIWQVNIVNCKFLENGGNGAAMEIIQHSLSFHHMIPLFQMSIENNTFINNFMPSDVDGPILDFIRVEVSITNSTFTGSNTTVISLRNTYLNLFDDIWFENNMARVGGALKICEASLLFVHSGAHIHFINNSAQKGGAIYAQQPCMDTSPLCFIQPAVPQDTYVINFRELLTIEFVNNSAAVAGDVLYGGDLDICSTIVPYFWNTSQQHNTYWYSMQIFNEIFEHQYNNGSSWVSSDPRGICFCPKSQPYNNNDCITDRDPVEKYPGEIFSISAITVGQMNGSTSGMINVTLLDNDDISHTLLSLSNPKSSAECVDLIFVLRSNQLTAKITLRPITTEIATRYNTIVTNLSVHLLPCPLGFQLSDSPPYTCTCSPLFTIFLIPIGSSNISCNISSGYITIPQKRVWFGCFDTQQQNMSLYCDRFVVTPDCDYYCYDGMNSRTKVVEVSISNLDSQCSSGHTGIMCGACKPGYSRIFGGAFHCEKDCTNKNVPYLLLFFLVSGVILVVAIRALNLTVTEGTLNGFLVYTTVIQTHNSYFPEDLSDLGRVCWVFISWINLTFGIKVCFYKGMDGYQQIWAIFAQIFYFVIIVVIIVLLSRKFVFFTRLFGRNIIRVLATLVVMLYSNLIFATFNTFRYATLHVRTSNLNETLHTKVAWYYDGNVPYFGFKHALLFVTALICTISMLFFVFSLLLIQCLQKRSHFWCFSWVVRLMPFYEAYTGPCHDSYRFWPGFILFMRSGLYFMNSLIPTYTEVFFRIKMLITAAIFVIIMSLACIFPQGVYKRWPLNVLEFSFYLNLCITSGILGFNYNRHRNITAVYTSVCISALTFMGILLYHFHSQIKNTSGWKRVTRWFSCQAKYEDIHRMSKDHEEFESDDERASFLPAVVRFDDFREPLIEA